MGKCASYTALIFMLLTMIFHLDIFYIIGMVFLFYSVWRMLSKNYQKRYMENQKFLARTQGARRFFGEISVNVKRQFAKAKYDYNQRKIYAIFRCPNCDQKLRAPKGRGKIQVTCNKCKTQFIKKV